MALARASALHAQPHPLDSLDPLPPPVTEPPAAAEPVSADALADAILAARHPATGLAPSHLNHPGYQHLAFLYDKMVDALVLDTAGRHAEAEAVLDYFASRLRTPAAQVCADADANGVNGILKCYQGGTVGLVNALDVSSARKLGKARLEFCTTPGPLAFAILAMLQVNAGKYRAEAIQLGETLLAMQRPDGGVRDGDRSPERVYTEPHLDAYAAWRMLAEATGDARWTRAADAAYRWFDERVSHADTGTIDQGVWADGPNAVFATDVYSWTLAGPAGDRLPAAARERLAETMLRRGLVRVTVPLPDGWTRTLILADFADASDPTVQALRGGVHPMGSVEWTGGVILALQKQAARAAAAGDADAARRDKALAEALQAEAWQAFYRADGLGGQVTCYATGQGVDVGPFGTDPWNRLHGWHTPFFHAQRAGAPIRGGSLVGAWPLLPARGHNPFILHDDYRVAYDAIPQEAEDRDRAQRTLAELAAARSYTERVPDEVPLAATELIEPEWFNQQMWQALVRADGLKAGDEVTPAAAVGYAEAIRWAHRTVDHAAWRALARAENARKAREVGGRIWYPWGATFADNEHPLHTAILRYPLLNEVSASMWVLAIASYELGLPEQTALWMDRLIEELPLHQVANIAPDPDGGPDLINGYSNALVSWEDNPGRVPRDAAMRPIYEQVLRALSLERAQPALIRLPYDTRPAAPPDAL